jgi:pimeloyl-ACP methyl ester carboxylesterase
MEYQRAYRGLRQLAQTLTYSGFPVLRFDYSGTGDSGGDSRLVNLDYWIEDTQFAARELRAASGAENLCLIGLRFGALLAQEAVAAGGVPANAVALWDAPPSGDVFVRNLQHVEESLNELRSQQRRRSSQLPPPARDELLGFDWPELLAKQISSLPGLRNDIPGRVIFVSRDRTPPDSAESIRLPDAGHWSDVERLASPWLPAASFRIVAERLANGLP